VARPFVNLRISVIAAVVLCASVHGQTAATGSSTSENSLEAARRDLKSLPATERSRELSGKSSGLGSAGLPSLPTESVIMPPSLPEPNTPPSATWLQDALKQTDAVRAQRKPQVDSTLSREQAGGFKPTPAPDPFARYLEQWLSPRDLELLKPESKKTTDRNVPNSWEQPQSQAQPSTSAGMQDGSLSQPGSSSVLVPIMPATPSNPYIDESDVAPIASAQIPFAVQTTGTQIPIERSRVPTPLSSTTTTPLTPRQTASVKPAAVAAEVLPKPPTAPIVDDRKYFPQLRRF